MTVTHTNTNMLHALTTVASFFAEFINCLIFLGGEKTGLLLIVFVPKLRLQLSDLCDSKTSLLSAAG